MKADWLAQLAPERAPGAPSWWPPAPGWWICGSLLIIAGAALSWRWLAPRVRRARTSREAALAELEHIRFDVANSATAPAIQRLLRRYALTVFERDRVARLSGAEWLKFLAEHGGTAFAEAGGESFLSAAYGQDPSGTGRDTWIAAAEGFIKRAPLPAREPRA